MIEIISVRGSNKTPNSSTKTITVDQIVILCTMVIWNIDEYQNTSGFLESMVMFQRDPHTTGNTYDTNLFMRQTLDGVTWTT